MLVLTRKPGQSLYIGDSIRVTLQAIKGNQVRIGVEAPPSVRIYREEIYLQIMEENRSAVLPGALTDEVHSFESGLKTKKLSPVRREEKSEPDEE